MGCEVVALGTLSDEGTEFEILPHHFLYAHLMVEPSHTIGQAIERHLGSIWDIGEYGVCHIATDGVHDGWRELLAPPFPFLVHALIGTTAEIDALKRAGMAFPCRQNLFEMPFPILVHDERLTGLQLMYIVNIKVEGGLDDRALTGQDHHLVVLIVECGTYAPGVAHGKHLP